MYPLMNVAINGFEYVYVCVYIYIYWPCSIELLNYLMVAPSEKGQHGDLTLEKTKYQKTL